MDSINPIKILYEDNHLLGIIKPPNIPVQLDKSGDKDIVSYCKQYLKEKYEKPGNVYCGLVHRLDRPVGGVMIFGKTSKATARLAEQIREGKVRKFYRAIVQGDINIEYEHCLAQTGAKKGEWIKEVLWLLKDEVDRRAVLVIEGTVGAKLSTLLWRYYQEFDNNHSEVEIELLTGRYHQIRATFAEMGYPLKGDGKYGKPSQTKNLFLFSTEIRFLHPVTDEEIIIKAEPPW